MAEISPYVAWCSRQLTLRILRVFEIVVGNTMDRLLKFNVWLNRCLLLGTLAVGAYWMAPHLVAAYDRLFDSKASLLWRPGNYGWSFVDEQTADGLQVAFDSEGKPLFRKVYKDREHMVLAEISAFAMNPASSGGAKKLKFSDLSSTDGPLRELLVLTAYWFEPCEPAEGKTFSSGALACRRWGEDTARTTFNIRQADRNVDLPTWQAQFEGRQVDFYLWDDDLQAYWRFRDAFLGQTQQR